MASRENARRPLERRRRRSSWVARVGSDEVAGDGLDRVWAARSTSDIIRSFQTPKSLPISDATLSETSSHETSVDAGAGMVLILASCL